MAEIMGNTTVATLSAIDSVVRDGPDTEHRMRSVVDDSLARA